MTNTPHTDDDLKSLWQSLPHKPVTLTIEELRHRSRKLDSRIRRRFIVEYAAAIFVVVTLIWYATWPEPKTPLWPIANITLIVGTIVVMWNLHRVSRRRALPLDGSINTLASFHRDNLVQQRDALRAVWLWYLMPFVPGVVLWIVALWISRPAGPAGDRMGGFLVISALAVFAWFALLYVINLFAASRLQRLIDELDKFEANLDA